MGLIDAEWLKEKINTAFFSEIGKLIDDAPTIDVVRCKECRYKDMELCAMHKLAIAGVRRYDDFCSYGEREGK